MLEKEISVRETNLRTIKAIKQGLKEVGTRKVLKRLGFTQQNLSKHLSEKSAEKVNIDILEKVVNAIEAEKKIIAQRAARVLKQANQLVNQ